MTSSHSFTIRWREEHRKLRERLDNYHWTAEELTWLLAHAKDWPPELESLIRRKLNTIT
jgi:hypothetical protein